MNDKIKRANANDINSKRLADFRGTVEDIKAMVNRTEGELNSILGVLKDKYGIESIAEARTRIINIVPEIEKKQNQADELADEVNDLLTEIETELR